MREVIKFVKIEKTTPNEQKNNCVFKKNLLRHNF